MDWIEMHDKDDARPRCPKCGSEKVAEILWGMPAYSEELQYDLDEGRVVLGGCFVGEDGEDPFWHCTSCGHEFA